MTDFAEIGFVRERRLVAEGADSVRMEWHRVVVDEEGLDQWFPKVIDGQGNVIEEPVWMPLPGSQFLFLQCPVFEALYEGQRGASKTLTLLMDFAREIGKGYGSSWRGILFRREYKDLDDVVKKIEEWFPKLFPGFQFKRSKSEYSAHWPTGEALLLRHLESVDDYANYHGHEYPWIAFEELTQWEDDAAYLKIQSCCRSSTPGIPCRVRASTNPSGIGHGWVKKRFQLPRMRSKIIRAPGEMERVAIHGSLEENFLLMHATPHYRKTLKQSSKNPAEVRAWLYGDWDVTAGGMFDDLWRDSVHVIPDFPASLIPRGWTLTRAYDHGQSKPFAYGLWLESNGEPITLPNGRQLGTVRGDLILWKEWYGTTGEPDVGIKASSKRIGEGIRDRESDWGVARRVRPGPADTEIFNKESDRNGRCPGDDMEDVGVTWERADKSPGSRKRGWTLIRSRLESAIPADDGTREGAGLFVCSGCQHWIELVPSATRDTVDQDEIPDKYEDHLADMTRYRVNWVLPVMWRRGF